jgi:hypothetical protein
MSERSERCSPDAPTPSHGSYLVSSHVSSEAHR